MWAVSNKTIGLFYCLAPADGRYQGFALIGKNRVQMNDSVIKATYRSSVLTATTQQIVKVTIDLAIWMNVSTKWIVGLLKDNDLARMTV